MALRDRGRNAHDKILDVDASMQGKLTFKDAVNLRINGKFDGTLETKGTLTIGETGDVTAHIIGEDVVIAGKVRGDILAKKRLTIQASAVVEGKIRTAKLIVVEGGDGAGKSTQLDLLCKRLESAGRVVEHLHFPKHESRFGKVVDAYLRGELGSKDINETVGRYIPFEMVKMEGKDGLPAKEALELVYDLGGLMVMAHPGEQLANKPPMYPPGKAEEFLNKYASYIQGVETYSGKHSSFKPYEEMVCRLNRDNPVYRQSQLLETLGSDTHNNTGDLLLGRGSVKSSKQGNLMCQTDCFFMMANLVAALSARNQHRVTEANKRTGITRTEDGLPLTEVQKIPDFVDREKHCVNCKYLDDCDQLRPK